jgi:rhodanese-related sulfurtransferase/DNA-binding CsgD family transcriptional regulator
MSTEHRRFKDALYEQFARVGKAVAAPKRLELLDLLGQGPRTVEAIADQAGISVANASQHLRILRAARLVDAEKKGLYVEYRLTVIDVRPTEEYRAGHVPGALSIPVGELKNRLKELPKNREVVAYCRGPYCVMAVEAVELLRKKGLKARRMELGVVDWRARGWKIDSEAAGART